METRKKHVGFIASVCMAVMLFSGALASAQLNIPDAVDDQIIATDGSVWEQVSLPGFENTNNMSVVAMAEYQGSLYAMTRNQVQGTEIWRTNASGGWEQVAFPNGVLNGVYGNPWINNVWGRMIVFQDKLYFGFSSGLQGNYLGSTGCEIWRYDGTTWEPVISDKRAVEVTGTITTISTCGIVGDTTAPAYFYDSSKTFTASQWNGGVLTITSGPGKYRKFRIVATSATGGRLTVQQNETAGTYTTGTTETEMTVCAEQIYDNPFPQYSYTLGAVSVGDSYEINTGWEQNGFGNMWNKTITAMRVFDGKLYVSTGLNYEHGGQIWYTADGDTWQVTSSVLETGTYTTFSFGNYHTDAAYPGSRKPVSSSVTDLVVSSVSGTPTLYAGGTGTSGTKGGCARLARLTPDTSTPPVLKWGLIVENAVDTTNTTGSNENGFGSPSNCTTNKFNFMPWSLADFNDELLVGISGAGARVLRAPYLFAEKLSGVPIVKDMKDDGRWFYSVGEGNVADGYTDPLGTSNYLNGFDGYQYPGTTNYQNLAVNLFPFRNMLYGGTISQYVPEYSIPADLAEMKGAQIWKSPNGMTWTQITADGLGDSNTVMFEAFTDFGGTLYVAGSKGASSTPSGLGGAKIFRLAEEPCVNVTADQDLASEFQRYTVTGITTELPGPDPNPPGLLGASYLRAGDLDGDGKKEIVATSTTGASLDYRIKDGAVHVFQRTSEDLSTWTQSVIRADFAFANDILIRDVDGDGEVDIMVFDNFLAGEFTGFPGGVFYLKNLGGDVTDPANWEKIAIYEGEVIWDEERPDNEYLWAKSIASFHQAYFVDLDGDAREDFVTSSIAMYLWGLRGDNPLYDRQYQWTEWFKAETDRVAYPSGFSGPYAIGDGAGFLFDMADLDGDNLLDILGPQYFITEPGTLNIKGSPAGDNPHGDSLMWFKNPGPAALASDPNVAWERYTIDNWYTSPNPLGKGFMAFPADITNDGKDEIIFTSHNHQDYKPDTRPANIPPTYAQYRIWPSGVFYLSIPEDPYDRSNWAPVAIDTGDAYKADRPGGPYAQGSPGFAAVGDVSGDSLNDLVVAGDGRGAVYYYQAQESGSCLEFRRAALWDNAGSMSADVQLFDLDNDGRLEVAATVYDTSFAKNSSSGSVFIWKRLCQADSDCADGLFCNGAETCVEGACAEGSLPCGEGEYCDEDNDQCVACLEDENCAEGYECVDGECVPVIADDPPALTAGPYLAAGTWTILPTSAESPMYLDANYDVVWTFSDDFASCSDPCTHVAEYQVLGGSSWTALPVTANGYAYVTLPIESLQNATTYAFRYSVTDCASQTTQSQVYYFRVATSDAPPVITSGPFLAAGSWQVLPTSASKAFVLDQNEYVLWTFSDDYAYCSGLCTHRARYRKVGDTAWTWITVGADPTGKQYAYTELPVEGLAAGTYQFYFDVRDCAGQLTKASKIYYFKVE